MKIQNITNSTNYNYYRSMNELASGKRSVVSAPAEIAIGNRFHKMVKTLEVANTNISNGISYSQTIDASMQHTGDALGRLKELSVQANNGMLSDVDRASVNKEAQELISYINDQSNNTSFNGKDLLKGGSVSIAVDGSGNETTLENPDIQTASLGIDSLDLSTQAGAASAISAIDNAINSVSQQRVTNASQENILSTMKDANSSYQANLYEAGSKLTDVDMAQAATKFTSASMLQNVSFAMQAQANKSGSAILNLLK